MQNAPYKEYLLVIKRNVNNYLPIDWSQSSYYNGENLYTIEGIDAFTRKVTRYELAEDIIKKHLIDPNEEFMDFAIIFKVKNRDRELKEGVIFKEDNVVFSENDLLSFILKNSDNKQLMNKIYNICYFKEEDPKLETFKYVINNIETFKAKGPHGLEAALSTFKELSYHKKRTIILKVTDNILMKMIAKEEPIIV